MFLRDCESDIWNFRAQGVKTNKRNRPGGGLILVLTDGPYHPAGFHALCTYIYSLCRTVYNGSYSLNIRLPSPFCFNIGMANFVADCSRFPAYVAFGHEKYLLQRYNDPTIVAQNTMEEKQGLP